MKLIRTAKHRSQFDLLFATRLAQAAMMTLQPGGSSDDQLANEHPKSEQWLFVLSGRGTATVVPRGDRRRRVPLRAGMLLLIERGERHQITNSGNSALRTLNIYVPPAYRSDESVRPNAKRKTRR